MNALEAATDALKSIPPYGHREARAAGLRCDAVHVGEGIRVEQTGEVPAAWHAQQHAAIFRVGSREVGGLLVHAPAAALPSLGDGACPPWLRSPALQHGACAVKRAVARMCCWCSLH